MRKLTLGLAFVSTFAWAEVAIPDVSGKPKQPLSKLSGVTASTIDAVGKSKKRVVNSQKKRQLRKSAKKIKTGSINVAKDPEESRAGSVGEVKISDEVRTGSAEMSRVSDKVDIVNASKTSDEMIALTAKIDELLNSKYVLEKENSSLREQVQKLQERRMDSEDEINSLNIKILGLEQEKEDLLQKLFDHQVNMQEVKAVSFELNSLLNQIPAEDEITKDSIKLLQDLNDMDERVDQILVSAESVELTSDEIHRIEKISEELKTMQESVQKKVEFFKNHELKLMDICNKEKYKLPKNLDQLKVQLTQEQKKFPELKNLKIEENLMSSINTIKSFRQSQSAKKAEQLKSIESKLHEYVGLKIKESDLQRLEHKTRDFSDNIAKIEVISSEFIKKNDRLESMRNEALKSVAEAKAVNDNNDK